MADKARAYRYVATFRSSHGNRQVEFFARHITEAREIAEYERKFRHQRLIGVRRA